MFRKGPQHTATNPASRHLQTSQVLVLTFVPHAIPLLGSFFILLDGKSTRRFLFVVFSNSYQSSIEAFIGFSVLVHTFVPHAIPLLGSLLIILDGKSIGGLLLVVFSKSVIQILMLYRCLLNLGKRSLFD